MATPTLKSPGPGFRALQLSDGSSIWMPPEATVDNWRTATQQGETALNQKYMAQAAAQNSPVTTKGMVYSATAARPNTPYGHLMGWIDHNLGGNALNASPTAQAVNSYAAPVVQSGARIATGAVDAVPLVGASDLALTGANIAKHVAAKVVPALNQVPDAQTASGWLRDVTGTPSLSPNASELQKIVEATGSAMANPNAALGPTFARVTGAETGQQISEHLGGGEVGGFFGSLLGASPETGGSAAAQIYNKMFAGGQAPGVAAAGERTDVQPSAGMLMNPTGRRIVKGLGSFPILGGPIQDAQARVNNSLLDLRNNIATGLYGSDLPEVSKTSIGQDLITGARQGAANVSTDASNQMSNLRADIGPNQPTDVRAVYRDPNVGYPAQANMDPASFQPLAARLDNLRTMAIQAQMPQFQATSGPMPAGSAPFQRVASARSNLGAEIPGSAGLDKGTQSQLYARMTDEMRAAAVAKDPSLGPMFDQINEKYKNVFGQGGQLDQLQTVGGKPVGGYGDMASPNTVQGAEFTGGKDEGAAYNWLKSNLTSPSTLEPFADPTITPNDYWRRVSGGLVSQLGDTSEGTFRPDTLAKQWSQISPEVQTQLFQAPNGGTYSGLGGMSDAATLGRETVVPVERAGLTNTAGSMLAVKTMLDVLKAAGGLAGSAVGGRLISKGLESQPSIDALSGNITPLTDALYNGLPMATQSILQNQNNQDPRLGYSVTPGQ